MIMFERWFNIPRDTYGAQIVKPANRRDTDQLDPVRCQILARRCSKRCKGLWVHRSYWQVYLEKLKCMEIRSEDCWDHTETSVEILTKDTGNQDELHATVLIISATYYCHCYLLLLYLIYYRHWVKLPPVADRVHPSAVSPRRLWQGCTWDCQVMEACKRQGLGGGKGMLWSSGMRCIACLHCVWYAQSKICLCTGL